jgi:hypothetical protein
MAARRRKALDKIGINTEQNGVHSALEGVEDVKRQSET